MMYGRVHACSIPRNGQRYNTMCAPLKQHSGFTVLKSYLFTHFPQPEIFTTIVVLFLYSISLSRCCIAGTQCVLFLLAQFSLLICTYGSVSFHGLESDSFLMLNTIPSPQHTRVHPFTWWNIHFDILGLINKTDIIIVLWVNTRKYDCRTMW